ncbi:unnamed protein product [Ranitomeya imitator]|uniref:Uncharacterized protein n=1 Tax=Ranitomeya imitator TaxID=111125 RepID=A0ABN9LWS5_9NEOB|nr:unnamed protein product [Ranitomeya imitator]
MFTLVTSVKVKKKTLHTYLPLSVPRCASLHCERRKAEHRVTSPLCLTAGAHSQYREHSAGGQTAEGDRHRWSLESCLCDSSPATKQRRCSDRDRCLDRCSVAKCDDLYCRRITTHGHTSRPSCTGCIMFWRIVVTKKPINGFIGDSMPGLVLALERKVRWHLLSIGRKEIISVQFHGNILTQRSHKDHPINIVNLYPARIHVPVFRVICRDIRFFYGRLRGERYFGVQDGVGVTLEMKAHATGLWHIESEAVYESNKMKALYLVYDPTDFSSLSNE